MKTLTRGLIFPDTKNLEYINLYYDALCTKIGINYSEFDYSKLQLFFNYIYCLSDDEYSYVTTSLKSIKEYEFIENIEVFIYFINLTDEEKKMISVLGSNEFDVLASIFNEYNRVILKNVKSVLKDNTTNDIMAVKDKINDEFVNDVCDELDISLEQMNEIDFIVSLIEKLKTEVKADARDIITKLFSENLKQKKNQYYSYKDYIINPQIKSNTLRDKNPKKLR